jgi:hypothetical protein
VTALGPDGLPTRSVVQDVSASASRTGWRRSFCSSRRRGRSCVTAGLAVAASAPPAATTSARRPTAAPRAGRCRPDETPPRHPPPRTRGRPGWTVDRELLDVRFIAIRSAPRLVLVSGVRRRRVYAVRIRQPTYAAGRGWHWTAIRNRASSRGLIEEIYRADVQRWKPLRVFPEGYYGRWKIMVTVVPWWFITAACAAPVVWSWRRRRKDDARGFEVNPAPPGPTREAVANGRAS